ncbi:MAG: RNA methyltransferase substrate-binding domain-containing protein, partial [Thermomicrobiales bacterium]
MTNQTNRPGGPPSRNQNNRQRPGGPGRGPNGPGGGRGPRPPIGPRSYRQEILPPLPPGHEFIYGRNAVAETLRGNREIYGVTFAETIKIDDRLKRIEAAAAERGLSIDRSPRELLDALAPANHQGVILEAGGFQYAELDEIKAVPGTVLVFDHLQDPQNLGTL